MNNELSVIKNDKGELTDFDKIKAEVEALVENVKKTVVSQPGDVTGYELMKENKKCLQVKRTEITKIFKADRDVHTAHNKLNLEKEREILSLISPIEERLGAEISAIDEAKKREKRMFQLPNRKERLLSIEVVVSDEEILSMDDADFESFFTEKKSLFLEEKERKMLEEQAKIEAEKKRLAEEEEKRRIVEKAAIKAKAEAEEAAKLALAKAEKEKIEAQAKAEREKAEAERARIAAEAKAKQDLIDAQARAEKEKADAILAAEAKAAKEKQDLIDEQKRKEDERIAKELADKAKAEKEKADAEEAQRQLEAKKKYQKFLADNNYNPDTDKIFDNCIYRFVAKYE